MLSTPREGQNILRWAKEATREINSNHIQNGLGIKVTRTPNGTNLIVAENKSKLQGKTTMPFDCMLVEQTEKSSAVEVHILNGNLYYGTGNGLVKIQQTGLVGVDYWDLSISVTDGLTLGIVCNYDSESEDTSVPDSFSVGEIPPTPDSSGIDYGSGTKWMDAQGLHYYPLVKFVKFTAGQTYDGPYAFSIGVTGEGEEPDIYYAVQCYHGDIVFDNNDYSPWIGEVQSGGHGTYAVRNVDGSGQNADVIHVVEQAECTTLPYGSRVIVHRIMTESLSSGAYGA